MDVNAVEAAQMKCVCRSVLRTPAMQQPGVAADRLNRPGDRGMFIGVSVFC